MFSKLTLFPDPSLLRLYTCVPLLSAIHVIHHWGLKFQTLIATLRQFFSMCKTNPDSTFIHIDVLCEPHHGAETLPADLTRMCNVIKNAEKVSRLALADRRRGGSYKLPPFTLPSSFSTCTLPSTI